MDVHVRRAVTEGLHLRGVDVLTAQEDGAAELSDSQLLDRASILGRILFTQDDDLLEEARMRLSSGVPFVGVAYAHQLNIGVGQCIADLELVAKTTDDADWVSQVVYLPF
jgi:hypothetical protein